MWAKFSCRAGDDEISVSKYHGKVDDPRERLHPKWSLAATTGVALLDFFRVSAINARVTRKKGGVIVLVIV